MLSLSLLQLLVVFIGPVASQLVVQFGPITHNDGIDPDVFGRPSIEKVLLSTPMERQAILGNFPHGTLMLKSYQQGPQILEDLMNGAAEQEQEEVRDNDDMPCVFDTLLRQGRLGASPSYSRTKTVSSASGESYVEKTECQGGMCIHSESSSSPSQSVAHMNPFDLVRAQFQAGEAETSIQAPFVFADQSQGQEQELAPEPKSDAINLVHALQDALGVDQKPYAKEQSALVAHEKTDAKKETTNASPWTLLHSSLMNAVRQAKQALTTKDEHVVDV